MYYNAKIHGINLSQLEVVVMYFNDSLSGSDYSSRTHFLTSEYQMDMKTEGWQRWEAVLPSHIQLRSVQIMQICDNCISRDVCNANT